MDNQETHEILDTKTQNENKQTVKLVVNHPRVLEGQAVPVSYTIPNVLLIL